MAAGNWVPELIEMLGAVNLFGTAGGHSPWMQWDELAASDPDAVICMPCGYDVKKTRWESALDDGAPGLERPARGARGTDLSGRREPVFQPAGSASGGVARNPGGILFPEIFEPHLEKLGWERFGL